MLISFLEHSLNFTINPINRYIIVALIAGIFTIIYVINVNSMLIKLLNRKKCFQPIRQDGPISHLKQKANVTNLGGITIISSILIGLLLFTDVLNIYVLIIILSLLLFGLIGFFDDVEKIRHSKGISAKKKILLQLSFSIIICSIHYFFLSQDELCYQVPFLSRKVKIYKELYYFFFVFIICGSSNAFNLTDGLDGLASNIFIVVSFTFAVICLIIMNGHFFSECNLNKYKNLFIVSIILFSTFIGFLWHNSNKAEIFMGDASSLSVGAVIALMFILINQELSFAIVSLFPIIEVLSVAIQVVFFKFTRKKFFRMSPIHHHFELGGISEEKIVTRIKIFSVFFSILTLLSVLIKF